jgi:hypothetical protein
MEIGQKKNDGIYKKALQDHKNTGTFRRCFIRKNDSENNGKVYLRTYAIHCRFLITFGESILKQYNIRLQDTSCTSAVLIQYIQHETNENSHHRSLRENGNQVDL